MKAATLALALVLLPSLASAVPIIPPMLSCHCTLVDVTPILEPTVDTTGGWDVFAGTAEEKAAAQLADLLHEPPALDRILEWACADKPPIVVPPDGPHGGGGSGGSGGGGNAPVAEPSLFALAAVGVAALRWRNRA